ncbi:pyridoxal phosphate-dependent transferase [Dactylonectria macrodidyma]|uniref:Pyridoxal phosphate-dependent transferase n=1 Tax=Dactylonectria macrodidyma TaxID=307937 RepID=A0A9P9F642_9HYPO|nr:pyridoxal phosphate-dependent transferase [Dactylonectria macrodidyma]
MVQIKPFKVEQWMDKYETTPGVLNIAETCAASVSVDDLVRMCKDPAALGPLDTSVKLTYGPIVGSQALRERAAAHCSSDGEQVSADNVIITQGAIGANFLALYALLGPGDHVVCVYPTYQQLYEVPRSLGAEVSLWRLRAEDGFVPQVDALRSLIKENTKMIIINNPNNPTGAPIPDSTLRQIVQVAEAHDIILFSDEVYRPLFHGGAAGQCEVPAPATTFGYDRAVVTGSMSKGFALAGIRVGWVATRDEAILLAMASARDYNTISVSQMDDQIASYALSPAVREPLVTRNMALARTNAKLLKRFVDGHGSVCSWVEPKAGTTAFIQFKINGQPVNDVEFCMDLLEKTKVFFCPGSHCFGEGEDFPGYVRMGYVCETEVLEAGLLKLEGYVERYLS